MTISNIESQFCRICATEVNAIKSITDCLSVHPELRTTPYIAPAQDITIYLCPNCSHMQIKDEIKPEFYESYQMDYFNPNINNINFINLNSARLEALVEYGVNQE